MIHLMSSAFQSRNRVTSLFKSAPLETLLYGLASIAIPRATNFGARRDEQNIWLMGPKHGSSGFLAPYEGPRFFGPFPLTGLIPHKCQFRGFQ